MLEREGDLFRLKFSSGVLGFFESHGEVPLPPYIARPPDGADRERYQTVYARTPGAVAAPTAGLALRRGSPGRLEACGVRRAFVTLHVGAGTFQPVRVDDIDEHEMHREYLEVGADACAAINAARAAGGRVVAVGTTVVRSLETAAAAGGSGRVAELTPYRGATRLFIRPGYRFRAVDAMVTNFHLPESTLLMLCAAFAGGAALKRAYAHAVAARYRFFSYGDAMFMTPAHPAPPVRMQFDLLATDGAARRGRLEFARGTVETPAFMPVGTYGTVKAMTPEQLEAAGAQIVLGNTFHLYLRPGLEVIEAHGGLHRLHALGASDSHRLGRLSGLEPEGHAPDQRAGCELSLADRRRAGVSVAGGVDAHPAHAALGHRHVLR